ncbi:MAG: anthranilate synthase component I family protein, partial [Akkermansia sp.]
MTSTPIIHLTQKSRRLSADLETPISLFLSVAGQNTPGILLESAEVDGQWGRYSVIACDFLLTASCRNGILELTIDDERLAPLKALNGLPFPDGVRQLMRSLTLTCDDAKQAPITRALYGYFGYETAALLQPKLTGTIKVSDAESCLVLP